MSVVEKWASEDNVGRFLIVWRSVEMPDQVGYDGERVVVVMDIVI